MHVPDAPKSTVDDHPQRLEQEQEQLQQQQAGRGRDSLDAEADADLLECERNPPPAVDEPSLPLRPLPGRSGRE